MTTSLAVRLRGDGIAVRDAGGKGSALDRLVALGARVPRTAVVTTEAYRRFTADPAIADFLATLRSEAIPDTGEYTIARSRVDEAFLGVPLPTSIDEALDRVVAEVTGPAGVAVRSSATAEDMGNASFAGQYESYLDVEPGDASMALRKVWASLWYPSPRSYRRYRGIDDSALAMAVVVMEMLDPSIAGVLFTVDPGGRQAAMRLEVVQGLGEQLVSGAVTPDAYVVDRDDLPGAFAAITPALGDLATEALRLEDALGSPQDIEFAVDHDELYLVQARPITAFAQDATTDDGFDFSCGTATTYTTAGIAEMLPGVVPPLLWGIDSWLVENGFRALFGILGGGASELTDGHALIGRFAGRAALNLDAMRDAAGSIPGGSPEELEQQYFGTVVKTDEDNRRTDEALHRAGASQARQGVRVLRARRDAAEHAEVAVQTVQRLVPREPDLAAMDDAALIGYWNRLLHVAQRVAVAEVAVAAMAAASYRGVEVFLSRYMDSATAGERARQITSNDNGQRRATIALAVEPIVARLRSDPALRAVCVEDWDATRTALARTTAGTEIITALRAAWTRAGSTRVFAGPTWAEVPKLAWLTVWQQLTHPTRPSAGPSRLERRAQIEHELTHAPSWRTARWLTHQVFDVRRRFFRRQADEAAEFLDRREATKAAFLQLGGLVRRCHLEFGRRLVAAGRLETPDDVQFIGIGELEAMFASGGPTLQTIASRRRLDERQRQAPAPPLVWTGTPEPIAPDAVDGERFEGWAASPGRYEGLARVVRSPAAADFCRGEILVAETTDASWTPLFLAAGAIVVEQGGPLSHAAIVARELGLPTVVNVPGFVARLEREGGSAPIVVDGTTGVVTIQVDDEPNPGVDASEATAYAPAHVPDRHWDDTSMRFNVFVAGLMGAGALMSVIVGLTESISSTRGHAHLARRATPVAQMLSAGVVDGFDAVTREAVGLRPRRHYAWLSIVLALVGAAITARSSALYFDGNIGAVGWALTVTSGIALVVAAILTTVAAARWPRVPSIVRRFLPGYPPNPDSIWAAVPRSGRIAIAVMVGLVAFGAFMVVFALPLVLDIDHPLYFDVFHAGRNVNRYGPGWFNQFGYAPFLIVVPTVVFVITWVRCRAVAIAYPIMIATGGAIFLMLNWTVHRLRPPLSVRAGQYTSYPGGHSIQVTLVLLAIPLVIWVLTSNVVIRVLSTVGIVAVWAIEFIDNVRVGAHWPIDQLAGLLIALCLLIVVYSVGINALRERDSGSPGGVVTSPPRHNLDGPLVRPAGSHDRSRNGP